MVHFILIWILSKYNGMACILYCMYLQNLFLIKLFIYIKIMHNIISVYISIIRYGYDNISTFWLGNIF